MSFKLTEDTWENLWGEGELKGLTGWKDTDTDEMDWATLAHVGEFRQCYTPLSNSLGITVQEWEMLEDLLHHRDSDEVEPNSGAGLAFYISGKVQTQLHGLTEAVEERVGYFDFCSCAELAETELWQAGEQFLRVYIGLDPLRLFGELNSTQLAQLPIDLQQTLEGNYRPFCRWGMSTPEMHRVLRQILQCPYEGMLKRLYFQSKAWELIALSFEQLQSEPPSPLKWLKQRDLEQLHQARALLMDRLNDPLSLIDLAKQVGLNEFALKQGFRQVFGTTVFRYLHDYRLDVARQLLLMDDLPIQTLARRVGFANRGYFAAAFRKKFGLSPREYRLRHHNSGS